MQRMDQGLGFYLLG